MNLKEQLDALLDATAFDSTGAKVGAVRQLYVDDASGKLTFATVSTGIFSADAIVPLHGARLLDDELHVDHTRAVIRDSPRPEHTEDALTPDQEINLLEHYGLEAPDRGRDAAEPRPKSEPKSEPKPAPVPGGTQGASAKAAAKGDKGDKDKPASPAAETPEPGVVKPGAAKAPEPGVAKPGTTQNPPAEPDAAKSAPSPVEKKADGRPGSPAGSDSKSGGSAGGQKTAGPATAQPGTAPTAAPGEKSDGKVAAGEKKTTTTSSPSPSPVTPPAGPDRTRAERPGSAGPDTAATSEDSEKGTSPERD